MPLATLYANALDAGTLTNSADAFGAANGTWAGVVNTSASDDFRLGMQDVAGGPYGLTGTQTVTFRLRKGSNSGNPTISAAEVWSGGVLAGAMTLSTGSTTISSTTGQDVVYTFAGSLVTGNLAGVSFRLAIAAAGGGPSARNSAQIDSVTWAANYETLTASPTVAGASLAVSASLTAGAATAEGGGGAGAPGPTPVVQATAASASSADTTSFAATMPAGVAVGDMLFANAVSDAASGAVPTITASTGWVQLGAQVTQGGSSITAAWFWRIADGTASDNLTVGLSLSEQVEVTLARISGARAEAPTMNAAVAASATIIDPPSHTHPGAATENVMWLVTAGLGHGATTFLTQPAGYGAWVSINSRATDPANGDAAGITWRGGNSSTTEDPGTYDINTSRVSISGTVAFRPASTATGTNGTASGAGLPASAVLTAGTASGVRSPAAPGTNLAAGASFTAGAASAAGNATASGAALPLGAAIAAGAATGTANANGTTASVAASFTPGSASASANATAAGSALAGIVALAAGTASGVRAATASGATLAAAASLAPGAASGAAAGNASGAALPASFALVGGTATGVRSPTASGASRALAASFAAGTANASGNVTAPGVTMSAAASLSPGTATGVRSSTVAGVTFLAGAAIQAGTAQGANAASAPGASLPASAGIAPGSASAGAGATANGSSRLAAVSFTAGSATAQSSAIAAGASLVAAVSVSGGNATGSAVATGRELVTAITITAGGAVVRYVTMPPDGHILRLTPESRTLSLAPESRTLRLAPESRTLTLAPDEARIIHLAPETRTLAA